jgi:hypothetical protein
METEKKTEGSNGLPKFVEWFAKAAGAYLVAAYFGASLFVPVLIIFLTWLIARKVTKPSFGPMVLPFSIQCGYALWVALGIAMSGHLSAFPDFLVLIVGVVFLISRPGLGSVIFLTIYHGIASLVNIFAFSSVQIGSRQFKIIIFHLGLRATAIFLMFYALKLMSNRKTGCRSVEKDKK